TWRSLPSLRLRGVPPVAGMTYSALIPGGASWEVCARKASCKPSGEKATAEMVGGGPATGRHEPGCATLTISRRELGATSLASPGVSVTMASSRESGLQATAPAERSSGVKGTVVRSANEYSHTR